MAHLFAQDGRLTDLTISRFLAGSLSDAEAEAVQSYLDANATATARVASIRAELAAPLPPLRRGDPLARDGRLTDLTISRFLAGSLSDAEVEALAPQLEAESVRIASVRAELSAPLPPLRKGAPEGNVIALPERPEAAPSDDGGEDRVVAFPRWSWGVVGGMLAAAVVLFAIWPSAPDVGGGEPQGDTIRFRGQLSVEVMQNVPGVGVHALPSGSSASAGDQLGFVVSGAGQGYLMLLGSDGRQQTYPIYATDRRMARVFDGGRQALPAAIALDETPGTERLIAVLCEGPFAYSDVEGPLRAAVAGLSATEDVGLLRVGCAQVEVRLQKEAP
jgi:hypothetical protein